MLEQKNHTAVHKILYGVTSGHLPHCTESGPIPQRLLRLYMLGYSPIKRLPKEGAHDWLAFTATLPLYGMQELAVILRVPVGFVSRQENHLRRNHSVPPHLSSIPKIGNWRVLYTGSADGGFIISKHTDDT